jgi:hypothetical protein
MRYLLAGLAVLGLVILISACSSKPNFPSPAELQARSKARPAPPPAAHEESLPTPKATEAKHEAAAEAESEKPQQAEDQGTTPARPSLLFSLMLQPSELVMRSTLESMQAVTQSLSGNNVMPGLPRLGAGNEQPGAAAGNTSEAKQPDTAGQEDADGKAGPSQSDQNEPAAGSQPVQPE